MDTNGTLEFSGLCVQFTIYFLKDMRLHNLRIEFMEGDLTVL